MTAASGKEHLKKLLGVNQQIVKQNVQLQQQSSRLQNTLRDMMEENVELRQEISTLRRNFNKLKDADKQLRVKTRLKSRKRLSIGRIV